MFRPGNKPVLNLDLPKGVYARPAAQDHRPHPRAERSEYAGRGSGIRGAHLGLRHGVQDADRGAGDFRHLATSRRRRWICTAWASRRPTTTAGAACWRGGWSRRACASSASCPAAAAANIEWDAHSDIEKNHIRMAALTDQAGGGADQGSEAARAAGFDDRAVGRRIRTVAGIGKGRRAAIITTPASRCGWRAAASRAARSYGATDEIGLKAVENPVHFRDLHATMLNQLGLNQDQLSYLHLGRKERLTEVHGRVIKEILA